MCFYIGCHIFSLIVDCVQCLRHKAPILLWLASQIYYFLVARAQFSHHEALLFLLFVSWRYSTRRRYICSRLDDLLLYTYWGLTRLKHLLVVTCTRFQRHKDILLLLFTYDVCVTKCFSCVPFDFQHSVSAFFLWFARSTIRRRISLSHTDLLLYYSWRLTRQNRLVVVTCTRFSRHRYLLLFLFTCDVCDTKCFSCIYSDNQHIISIFFLLLARSTSTRGSSKLEEERYKELLDLNIYLIYSKQLKVGLLLL